jgi:hypothetical protein
MDQHTVFPRQLSDFISPRARFCVAYVVFLFAEGEYEDIAGQEEGTTKRVRQVQLFALALSSLSHFFELAFSEFPFYAGIRFVHTC